MGMLMFVNDEVNEPEMVICDKSSVASIMCWYGSHYAGDEYRVYFDGKRVRHDQNGDALPLVIEPDGKLIEHEKYSNG